tara:strand:- start:127 stop:495 length:369 start_codon:yes stop_codon:yes gene_type:complete
LDLGALRHEAAGSLAERAGVSKATAARLSRRLDDVGIAHAAVVLRSRAHGPTTVDSMTATVGLPNRLCATLAGRIGGPAADGLRAIEEIHAEWAVHRRLWAEPTRFPRRVVGRALHGKASRL